MSKSIKIAGTVFNLNAVLSLTESQFVEIFMKQEHVFANIEDKEVRLKEAHQLIIKLYGNLEQ